MEIINLKSYIESEMTNYNWSSEYNINCKYEFLCEVIFPNSIIRFVVNDNYDYVTCYILNPKKLLNKRGYENKYSIEGIIEAITSKTPKFHSELDSKIFYQDYIKQFIQVIYSNIQNVTNGDFSWHNRYEEINRNSLHIYSKMGAKINTYEGEIIYNKMLENDYTWERDLNNWVMSQTS